MQKVQRLLNVLNKAVSAPVVESGSAAGLAVRSDVRAGEVPPAMQRLLERKGTKYNP